MKLLILISISLLLGCNNKENLSHSLFQFEDTIRPKVRLLNAELYVNSVYDMRLYENIIKLSSYVDNNWIHYYDKNRGKHIKSFVARGRGKGEFLGLDRFTIFK